MSKLNLELWTSLVNYFKEYHDITIMVLSKIYSVNMANFLMLHPDWFRINEEWFRTSFTMFWSIAV